MIRDTGDRIYLGNSQWARRVQLTGSIVKDTKVETETIINAVSVEASGQLMTPDIPSNGADEIWILVSCDQQPWSLRASNGPWATTSAVGLNALYPVRNNVTNTFVPQNPARSLLVYNNPNSDPGWNHNGIAEAYHSRSSSDFRLRFDNGSETLVTVTIKTIRVWR